MAETARLAEYAHSMKLADVPEPARAVARAAMLDGIACAVAGRDERVATELRAFALGEGARGEATFWGTGEKSSIGLAALVNGATAHALDFDDVSWAMNGHPTVPLLPAAFALAEARGLSGADLLRAYVVGFEVQARLGSALGKPHYEKGWHATATMGVFGATAAAGVLLGLEPATLASAFGIAGSRASGTRLNFGTDTKPLHAGLAARAGVEAALFAARGISARSDVIEGEMGLADLYAGARPLALPEFEGGFALLKPGVELKPYPSCRFTHRAIDGILELRARAKGREPESIEIATDPLALKVLIYSEPRLGLEGKFSLQYCAAVAWLDGWPGVESFTDARIGKPDVQALLRRVSIREARARDEEIQIHFKDGSRDGETVRHARGNPDKPLSDAERRDKVERCLVPALGAERAAVTIAAFESLESQPSVAALARLVSP